MAGQGSTSGAPRFVVARYTINGSLDTSFNSTGFVITNIGGATNSAQAVILQPDGKIVAGGSNLVLGSNDFALVRYNTNGSIDTTFGTNGIVTTNFGSGSDSITHLALQTDGKIIAVGSVTIGGSVDFGLARYNSNGSLDNSFGTNGLVTTLIGTTDIPRAVLIQSDGKIVAIGQANIAGINEIALVRYNTNGFIDTTFGTNGLVITSFGPATADIAFEAVLQPDGKIVIAGQSNTDFALARYLIPSITISTLARNIRAKYTLVPLE